MAKSLLSNPPYNVKWVPDPMAAFDSRFMGYGVPPASNANYAFILSGLDAIDAKAAFILPNTVLESSNKTEKQIAVSLIEENVIDTIIILPDHMFESTSISTCILLLNKTKETRTVEMIDLRNKANVETREQKGQFGGKSHENRTYKKKVNVIPDSVISEVIEAIAERKNIKNLCKAVTIEELRINNYCLKPTRYIEAPEEEVKHRPYKDIADDYNRIIKKKNQIKITINETLAKATGLIAFKHDDIDLQKSFEVTGQKAEKENFIQFTRNAEFKIEMRSNETLPEVISIFLAMYKQMMMSLNNEENRILAEYRDALIPDLMSGKIEVCTEEKERIK